MIAKEVMMECGLTLTPEMSIADAMSNAANSELDIIPVVDQTGKYHGTVPKSSLVDHAGKTTGQLSDLCCSDALECEPEFALEHFQHDAESAVPHRTIVVVDKDGKFHGVIPSVHWAVDEAKTQSGHPRDPLEARTVSMHLTWRCLDCGDLAMRNSGVPTKCASCGADSNAFALYTED